MDLKATVSGVAMEVLPSAAVGIIRPLPANKASKLDPIEAT